MALDALRGGWSAVNSTYGVTRLVSIGNTPAPVPTALVDQIILRCDRKGKLLPPRLLKPGDQVTVTKGPFTDFVATIERIDPDRRVYVLMEMMGQQTRIAMNAGHIRTLA